VPIDSPVIKSFQALARQLQTCLVFGFAETAGSDVFNTAIFIDDHGNILGQHHKMLLAEGYRASWWDGHLTLNSDVFFDQYSNKQEEIENPVTIGIIVINAAKAQIYGGEFELDAIPFDGLTVAGTLGLLHTNYTSFLDPLNGTACGCFTGNKLSNSPDLQASLSLQYVHELPGLPDYEGFARIQAVNQSSSFADPNNTLAYEAEPLTTLNARVGITHANWGIYMWGNNLTNAFHLSGAVYELVTTVRAVNLPRTFGVELTLKN